MAEEPSLIENSARRWRQVSILLACGVFAAAIAYLLWRIHAVDAQRRALALNQFQADTGTIADNLDYFLSERHNDLEMLAESRAIEVYFENVAMGMSTRYGLLASSQEVETYFAKNIAERRINGLPVFSSLVLIDANSDLVAQSALARPAQSSSSLIPPPERWPSPRKILDEGFTWAILDTPDSAYPSILMGHPVLLNGRKVGFVLAELSFPVLLKTLFSESSAGKQRALFLGYDDKNLFQQSGSRTDFFPEFLGFDKGIVRLKAPPQSLQRSEGWTGACLVLPVKVADSSLRVYAVTPEDILLGSPTWPLSVLVAFLSLLLLLGSVFIIRANTARMILGARYEEQARSEKQLRKRINEFNTLFNALPGFAFYKDGKGLWVAGNTAVCTQANVTPEEVVGKHDYDLFPKHLADKFTREDGLLLSGEQTLLDTEDVLPYQGQMLTLSTRKVAVIHEDGSIGGIIGLGFDITEKKRAEVELRNSSALQKVIMDLAIGFVNLPQQELDQGIRNALAMIGEFAKVDRAFLFSYDFEARTTTRTHEWNAPDLPAAICGRQEFPYELFREWRDAHRIKELVHIPSVGAMPGDDPKRGFLEAQSIKTLITLPLVHGSACFGFVGFGAVREVKVWSTTEIGLLKVLAELLTNAELRRLHESDLIAAKAAAEAAYREVEERIRERTKELAQANTKLQAEISEHMRTLRDLNLIQSAISAILIVVDEHDRVFRWSRTAEMAFGLEASVVEGAFFADLPIPWERDSVLRNVERCKSIGEISKVTNIRYERADGTAAFLVLTVSPLLGETGKPAGYLLLGEDITDVKYLESRLSQAAKLEAIGQLAAGIAHEINTPTQFVSDSVTFLQDVFTDLNRVIAPVVSLCANPQESAPALPADLCGTLRDIDMEFIEPEIPRTFDRIFSGIKRISTIVQAMNRFSHSHGNEKKLINIHDILENTVVISRNEWKYVADMETDFDANLQDILGLADEMGQVFLNIIINAAHAIGDKVRGTNGKGLITISTRQQGECSEIRIKDSGSGIPPDVGDKVFNLFFTTKELGKGTGQGLAIAYDIVVNKHGGLISYESEPGRGTTFIVQLPSVENGSCGMVEERNQ